MYAKRSDTEAVKKFSKKIIYAAGYIKDLFNIIKWFIDSA
jgi:hypothetical protein